MITPEQAREATGILSQYCEERDNGCKNCMYGNISCCLLNELAPNRWDHIPGIDKYPKTNNEVEKNSKEAIDDGSE